MGEWYANRVTTGDSIAVKQALTLNGAGTSPVNPIMVGLGIRVRLCVDSSVTSNDNIKVYIGTTTPVTEKDISASLTTVDGCIKEIAGTVGEGVFHIAGTDYTIAQRMFLRVVVSNANEEVGFERQFWVKEASLQSVRFVTCNAEGVAVSGITKTLDSEMDTIIAFFSASAAASAEEAGYLDLVSDILEIQTPPTATCRPTTKGMLKEPFNITELANGDYTIDTYACEVIDPIFGFLQNDAGAAGGFIGKVKAVVDLGLSGSLSADVAARLTDCKANGATLNPSGNELDVAVGINNRDDGSPLLISIGTRSVPLSFPLTLFETWVDEFGQKQYGGAQLVSVFETAEGEGNTGSYVTPLTNADIKEVSSFEVTLIDNDYVYDITLRFRATYNDSIYVDKQLKFMLLDCETVQPLPDEIDVLTLPDIVSANLIDIHFENGTYTSFQEINLIFMGEKLTLPKADTTNWSAAVRSLDFFTTGGYFVVEYNNNTAGIGHHAAMRVTYYLHPTSRTVVVQGYRHLHRSDYAETGNVNEALLFGGDSTENVIAVFLTNNMVYKYANGWGSKGSANITPVPIENGTEYNLGKSLITYDRLESGTGNNDGVLRGEDEEEVNFQFIEQNAAVIEKHKLLIKKPYLTAEIVGGTPVAEVIYDGVNELYLAGDTLYFPTTWGANTVIDYLKFTGSAGSWDWGIGAAGDTGRAVPAGGSTWLASSYIDGTSRRFTLLIWATYTDPANPSNVVQYKYEMEFPTYIQNEVMSGDNDILPLYCCGDNIVFSEIPDGLLSISITGDLTPGTLNFPTANELLDISTIQSVNNPYITVSHTRVTAAASYTSVVRYPNIIPLTPVSMGNFAINGVLTNNKEARTVTYTPPKAKIDILNGRIMFDCEDEFVIWDSWSILNPILNQRSDFVNIFNNLVWYDISTVLTNLTESNYLFATFKHRTKGQVSVCYQITNNTFVLPTRLDYL